MADGKTARWDVYGLAATDPEIFHVLVTGDPAPLAALLARDPAAARAKMAARGETPLAVAAAHGALAACVALLDAGAELDAPGDGLTPLLHALVRGREAVAGLLLDRGAQVHLTAKGGTTALHYAAQACGPAMVERLIRAGVAVDARRERDVTPAILATQFGKLDNLKLLAKHGADLVGARMWINVGGPFESCLSLAASGGRLDLVEYLLALDWPADALHVALKLAAVAGHLEVAQALVARGADPLLPTGENQKSAMDRAKVKKQTQVVDYFKSLAPAKPKAAPKPKAAKATKPKATPGKR